MSLNIIKLRKLLIFNNLKYLRLFSTGKETHFGYENVSEEEKGDRVHEVFSKVADTYDLMNDVMSGGVHRLWKDQFINTIGPVEGAKLLDVAGGTGDIAFRYLEHLKNFKKHSNFSSNYNNNTAPNLKTHNNEDPNNNDSINNNLNNNLNNNNLNNNTGVNTTVTVLDINESMLEVGRMRAQKNGHMNDISWTLGDAESLPFEDNSFDVYTVAYGIRNMTHVDHALSEAHRVLKAGGMFACLEFSRVNNYVLRSLYDAYSFNIIPVMGKLVAGDFKSYKYLVESIRKFPDQEEFSLMIRDAGFKGVSHQNQLCGVSAIHTAFKI